MIKTTSRTATSDPITYEATATFTANGKTITASYHGDENESRKEVKEGAVISLKAKAKREGMMV